MAKTSRLDIIINDKLSAIFDGLVEDEGISRAEVVRRAVFTYAVLKQQQNQNKKLELVDQDGSNRKEVILM